MRKGKVANYDMFYLLKMLKKDCDRGHVTNLSRWFANWNTDTECSQILRASEIVKKNSNKIYEWNAENPTREMGIFVRSFTNQLKNYTI